jgi:hypothetical protein
MAIKRRKSTTRRARRWTDLETYMRTSVRNRCQANMHATMHVSGLFTLNKWDPTKRHACMVVEVLGPRELATCWSVNLGHVRLGVQQDGPRTTTHVLFRVYKYRGATKY